MKNLAIYYKEQRDYIEMLKLYMRDKDKYKKQIYETLIILNGNVDEYIINILVTMDFSEFNPSALFNLLIKVLKEKIEIIDLHFKYMPGGEGYSEAKKDFLNHVIN